MLRTEGLTKSFGALKANDSIDFDVCAGELHCLFGENGAGKSTLSSCLHGYLTPDAGQIFVRGAPVTFASPADAIAHGIGMVHQHFVLVEAMTVLENIVVGTHRSGWRLNLTEARTRLTELCAAFGLEVHPNAYVWELSVGEKQWVEILKAVFLGAEILILDEPTAVLTPQESVKLFSIIRAMQTKGIAVIIITHKLAEVMRADRVTVLRKGRKIATVDTAATTAAELTEMMIGRAAPPQPRKSDKSPGRVVVQTQDLNLRGQWGETIVDNVSLTVRSGEILGIAGVAGNGQKQLLELLAGIHRPDGGSILVGDEQLEGQGPAAYIAAGVGIIPEDRFAEGLIGAFSLADNVVLGSQRSPALSSGLFLNRAEIQRRARQAIEDYAIAASGIDMPVRTLSGGNAQKVILARELDQAKVLLLANQPTRGLDVGVVSTVHERLLQKRAEGCAIVLASEELDDLFALSDRLAVMFNGRIVGMFDPSSVGVEEVGALMAGHAERAA